MSPQFVPSNFSSVPCHRWPQAGAKLERAGAVFQSNEVVVVGKEGVEFISDLLPTSSPSFQRSESNP